MSKTINKKTTVSAKRTVLVDKPKHSGRGGRRPGAGRPKGTGKFGCPTRAIRIPIHLKEEVIAFVMSKIKTAKTET